MPGGWSIATRVALLQGILALAPGFAAAQSGFGPVPELDDPGCQVVRAGDVSANGRDVLVTQSCSWLVEPMQGSRGVLVREVRGSAGDRTVLSVSGTFVALSGDGQTIVGFEAAQPADAGSYSIEGVVADASGAVTRMGFLPDASPSSIRSSAAWGVSGDGSVVVGSASDETGAEIPVLWTREGGLQPIPMPESLMPDPEDPDAEPHSGWAVDVSGDGRIVVGRYGPGAFIWDAARGAREITDASARGLDVLAISADGTTVVGQALFGTAGLPFRWTEADGLQALAVAGSELGPGLAALATSADGEVVVGGLRPSANGYTPGEIDQAFVWTSARGMQSLRRLLQKRGAATGEWSFLGFAAAVSADGEVVLGQGERVDGASGTFEAFYGVLREPMMGVGLCPLVEADCIPVELVARTGQLALLPTGVFSSAVYSSVVGAGLARPVLAQDGAIAFSAGLREVSLGIDGISALFVTDDDEMPVLRVGRRSAIDDARIPGVTFEGARPFDLVLARDRELYFQAWLTGTGLPLSADAILRSRREGSLLDPSFVAGDSSVPLPEGTDARLPTGFQVDRSGRVTTIASWSDADTGVERQGVLRGDLANGYAFVVQADGAVPGIADPNRFGRARFATTNDEGRIALSGTLVGPDTTIESSGIWLTDEQDELVLLVRDGDLAPGFAETTTFGPIAWPFGGVSAPAIGREGDVVFANSLRRDALESDLSSLWRGWPDGHLEVLLTGEDPLPGLPEDGMALTLLEPWRNVYGDLLIEAQFAPGHSGGYWLRTGAGELVPLLRSGLPAPGLPTGTYLGDTGYRDPDPLEPAITHAALSDAGSALVEFHLSGPDVDATNDRALYLVDRAGHATPVLRKGDVLELGSGDVRTVADFHVWYGFQGGTDRRPIDGAHSVLASLMLADGDEAIVKLAVPEPRSAIGVGLGGLLLVALGLARRGAGRGGSARTARSDGRKRGV
ncbi:MAG: hypothetical protein H6748_12670 [Spirochaetaceae bacterium]|nr:hypothetical protein [Myxococcales bacterium]MCB9724895.1 hypothetical protein [Spirochaetaceae bacterium]